MASGTNTSASTCTAQSRRQHAHSPEPFGPMKRANPQARVLCLALQVSLESGNAAAGWDLDLNFVDSSTQR
eukprot:11205327-Lingulodinium_polyedra.AAC.1